MNTADDGGDPADELLAESIVDDAVRRRRARRWAERRALDDVDIAGSLSANVGAQVTVVVTSGEEIRGTVAVAGSRVVQLDDVATTHWIRADAIVAVTPTTGRLAGPDALPPVTADAAGPPLASLLADLVDVERSVELHLEGGVTLTGVVEAVGRSLVVSDPTGSRCVVAPDAVISVTLPG